MAEKTRPATHSNSVIDLINRLEHPLKPEIKALRQIILNANDQIREEIKWNSPSFYINQHFATLNLHSKQFILIIFHRGASPKYQPTSSMEIHDPDGIIEWLGKDRGAIKFTNMADVNDKKVALINIINQWIHQI